MKNGLMYLASVNGPGAAFAQQAGALDNGGFLACNGDIGHGQEET